MNKVKTYIEIGHKLSVACNKYFSLGCCKMLFAVTLQRSSSEQNNFRIWKAK